MGIIFGYVCVSKDIGFQAKNQCGFWKENGNGGQEDVIRVSIEQAFGEFRFVTQILFVLTVLTSCISQQQDQETTYLYR